MSHGMKLLHRSHSTNGVTLWRSLRKKRMTEEEIAAIAAKHRMAKFPNYRLKFADTYYGEMTHYGLYRLAWADVRRAR